MQYLPPPQYQAAPVAIIRAVGYKQKGHHFGRPVGTTWAVAA